VSFLGLRWDPCLTRSSFNGLEYHGDQLAIGQNVDAALAPPTSEESDAALDALDRYVLCGLLAKFRREFGYGETPLSQRALAPLLVLLPTHLERLALRAELASGWPVQRRLDGMRATLSQVLARQRYSYRHLLCEALPVLRSLLPPPEPLSPGLRLPPSEEAPRVGARRSLRPTPQSVPDEGGEPARARRQSA